ncbi:MAG: type II secretion system protein [bacterium]|nr:type II secretion system protein [bacterium]
MKKLIHKFLLTTFYFLFPRPRRGFTLIETVIYIGLFSIITSFVLVVFYQIIGGQNQQRNRVEVDSEANFMMQKMMWGIMGATAINQPALNATSATLSVTKYNYAQNPIVFDIGSRNLRITKASGTPVFLGSSRIYVNQLIFEHLPQVQSAPEAVKITMQVVTSDIERPVVASTTLTNTIYLRK